MRTRASGVVIREGKILLIRRINNGEEYFVLPGGGLEAGETIAECMTREMKEETCIDIKAPVQILECYNEPRDQYEHYFLIKDYTGDPVFGENEHYKNSSPENQSYLEWHDTSKLSSITNIYPEVPMKKLVEELRKQGL